VFNAPEFFTPIATVPAGLMIVAAPNAVPDANSVAATAAEANRDLLNCMIRLSSPF
jgi:hypothetical protein